MASVDAARNGAGAEAEASTAVLGDHVLAGDERRKTCTQTQKIGWGGNLLVIEIPFLQKCWNSHSFSSLILTRWRRKLALSLKGFLSTRPG